MIEKVTRSLRDSRRTRFGALILVSLTMMTGYFINYIFSPLKPLLEKHYDWTSGDFGIWNSAYSWFNVFLLMIIIGGIIIDKAV